MVMGLAAVIALPGPPAPCLSLPAGQARRGIPLQNRCRAFRRRGTLERAKDARIIYVIGPIFSGEMTIDDRATSRLVTLRTANCPSSSDKLTLELKVERSSGLDATSAAIA